MIPRSNAGQHIVSRLRYLILVCPTPPKKKTGASTFVAAKTMQLPISYHTIPYHAKLSGKAAINFARAEPIPLALNEHVQLSKVGRFKVKI